jgi:hypothetical protein
MKKLINAAILLPVTAFLIGYLGILGTYYVIHSLPSKDPFLKISPCLIDCYQSKNQYDQCNKQIITYPDLQIKSNE